MFLYLRYSEKSELLLIVLGSTKYGRALLHLQNSSLKLFPGDSACFQETRRFAELQKLLLNLTRHCMSAGFGSISKAPFKRLHKSSPRPGSDHCRVFFFPQGVFSDSFLILLRITKTKN